MEKLIQALLAAGFEKVTYPDQDGTFVTKKLTMKQMPDLMSNLIDPYPAEDDSEVFIELILSNNTLQAFVPDNEYLEDQVEPLSERGKEMLIMAGVAQEALA